MGTVREEELLGRIAKALEDINQELECVNNHLSSLEDLSGCMNERGQFCITGDITTYGGY